MAYIGNSPGVASQRIVSKFTATASQTTFTPTSGYTVGYLDVYLNGVKLINGEDYTASNGSTFVLASGAASGDIVESVAYLPRGLSDGYTKAEADARYMDINEFEGGAVFNESGADVDFRIESDANTHALFVDASADAVSIGSSSAARHFNNYIASTTSYNSASFEAYPLSTYLRNTDTTVGSYVGLQFAVGNNSDAGIAGVRSADANCDMVFGTRGSGSGAITERMRIDSAGRVTMPYQPSFRVGTSSSLTNSTDSNVDMIFTGVGHNTGGHYNSSTGVFTAPVNGVYQFSFSANCREDTGERDNIYVEFMRNGARLIILYTADNPDNAWHLISGTHAVYMYANDTMKMRQSPYSKFDSSMWTQFSGHLLG